MNLERIQELAALYSLGSLDGRDRDELEALLAKRDPDAMAELDSFERITTLLGACLPTPQVLPPDLKQKTLDRIRASASAPGVSGTDAPDLSQTGFRFVPGQDESGWTALRVPGAWAKLLANDEARGYAVVLGKLAAGARYPAHFHSGPEEIYVLSGDLHIGDHRLEAGDFHHADAGTRHEVNFSETGCTILAVITNQDLMAQLAPA